MWHEGGGIRGVNEISSCVMQHILSLPPNITHVTIFSKAGCLTQNSIMSCMFLTCLECHPGLLSIDYIVIPVPRLYECDSKFEILTNSFQSSVCQINVPSDWYRTVETSL